MIAVIDYNMGNLRSVENAFKKVGENITIVKDPEQFNRFDKLILPGVGAFGDAMEHLKNNGADEALKEFAKSGKPMLGICLGMQLLFEKSEEFGEHEGLSLIKGEIKRFDSSKFEKRLKVPHMGWNEVFIQKESPIFKNLQNPFYAYFVHSYHAVCEERYIIGTTIYGYEFTSAVQNGNIFGIQPHPEKSHENGLKIIKNFVEL